MIVISDSNSTIIAKKDYKALILSEVFEERFEGIGSEDELQIEC